MNFCAQIMQPVTLNPLQYPPNPTAETLTLEKSPNPTQTLTLRSKAEGPGLTLRAGMATIVAMAAAMAVANGERTPGLGPERPRGPSAPAAPTPSRAP